MSTCMAIRRASTYCESEHFALSWIIKILMLGQFFSFAGAVHRDKMADKHIPAASVRRVSKEFDERTAINLMLARKYIFIYF